MVQSVSNIFKHIKTIDFLAYVTLRVPIGFLKNIFSHFGSAVWHAIANLYIYIWAALSYRFTLIMYFKKMKQNLKQIKSCFSSIITSEVSEKRI